MILKTMPVTTDVRRWFKLVRHLDHPEHKILVVGGRGKGNIKISWMKSILLLKFIKNANLLDILLKYLNFLEYGLKTTRQMTDFILMK